MPTTPPSQPRSPQPPTTTKPPPPTSLSNNQFRPTVLQPQQPHAPLNKPRRPHHLNHNANHNYANHLTTFPATPTADPQTTTLSAHENRLYKAKGTRDSENAREKQEGTPMARGFSRLIFPPAFPACFSRALVWGKGDSGQRSKVM